MKLVTTFRWLIALFAVFATTQSVSAQLTKADVFDESKPITFLGVDYSLTTFIGTPENKSYGFSPWTVVGSKDNGVVTNDQFRDEFTPQWNQLFIDEPKKFDVAKATHRSTVKYNIDVAIKANKALGKKNFFSNSPTDFHTKTEADITNAVKNYDFQNSDGIGLIFFVEGMDKGVTSEGVWVTFVDVKSKTVLLTTYQTAKPGGSGFRNYWAKPLFEIVKAMESDFKKWK